MTTCFKGLERSRHDYRDYHGAEMDSYASTDSDAASTGTPTLITSPEGSKEWVILTNDSDTESSKKIKVFFSSVGDKPKGKSRSKDFSFTNIPNLKKMNKSWLKTQLILGASVKIFGKSTGKMIFYIAVGGGTGLIVGGAVGGVVGGIASGGPGVVPGVMVGGLVGASVGGAFGAGYGISKVIGDGIDDVKEFYRDFQILEDVENGSHKSVETTFEVAHKYFLNYLGEVGGKEMESHLFCSISGDIM